MNGHGTEPPDKHQSNAISVENELVLCEMEIKQVPIIKQEPEDDYGITTVSRLTYTANLSTQISIDAEQVGGNEDFADFCELDKVKLKVKIEKGADNANQVPRKNFVKNVSPQNDVINHFSKSEKQKTNGSDGEAKKNVIEAKKRKTNTSGYKKNISAGKANGKRHKCSLCDYVTDRTSNLKTHMLKHTGEKPLLCTICPKRFTDKRYLQAHMKKHVDEFPFSCSICLQGFNHNEQKLEHESGCSVRRYECHLCKEYSTLQKTNLENHLRVHTGEKPFQCDHCSKKFIQASNLKQHRKTHTNPRPRPLTFKCSVCFKNFTQQMEMENHEANCKRRGYKCDLCKSYATNQKSDFERHTLIHTGEKPFQCEICSKRFHVNSNLNRHKKIHNKIILV